jgi:hypothetical protein
MKRILWLFTLLILISPIYAVETVKKEPDFRNVYWGMTKNQILKSESLKIEYQDDHSLIYNTSISNKNCDLHYVFSDNKLYASAYYFDINHTNKNDFINDYNDLKNLLIKKYNTPEETDTIWKDELYRDDPSQWGMAISVGHLVYYSKWETEKTEITLILQGENFEIKLIILYKSKEYGPQAINKKEEHELQNL